MPCDLYAGRVSGGIIMFKDPIVEEVRAIRQQHAARFNYDLRKIAEDLREKQALSGHKTVSFPPKPAKHKAAAQNK